MQFAVYISDTPMTLKQSQGHQTYDESKVKIMQSLKELAFMVSDKKTKKKVTVLLLFFETRKYYVNYLQ